MLRPGAGGSGDDSSRRCVGQRLSEHVGHATARCCVDWQTDTLQSAWLTRIIPVKSGPSD